jgi:glycosyltransferase involved in cell wall biosynthesis
VVHPGIPFSEHAPSLDQGGPVVYVGPLEPDCGVSDAIWAAHEAGMPITVAGLQATAAARVHTEVRLRPKLRLGDRLLEETTLGERRELLRSACCLVAPRWPAEPWSLHAVEAMAMGTPVVGVEGTVLAEQVDPGVTGKVVAGRGDLPEAVKAAVKLDRSIVREAAAWAYDTSVMVDAYEGLFHRLLRGLR